MEMLQYVLNPEIEDRVTTLLAIKHPQHPPIYFLFVSDLRNASTLELTKHYCINFCPSADTMPTKLSSYVTWNASETVASAQLPLNSVILL